MPSSRTELLSLKNLLSQADRILATSPELPENRTAACRELLSAALDLTGDLLKVIKTPIPAAAILGRKGGSTTSLRHGVEHYRQMAAKRKTLGGGRPRKKPE